MGLVAVDLLAWRSHVNACTSLDNIIGNNHVHNPHYTVGRYALVIKKPIATLSPEYDAFFLDG